MIFFYVGLGFAMMTTVISIFETSTTLNKNQYTNRSISLDTDKLIEQRQNDKKFLQMLDDLKGQSLGTGDSICQNIKNGFTDELDSNYSILSNYSFLNDYNYGIPSYSTNVRLENSCNLVKGFHRIIIVPSSIENNAYNIYTCMTPIFIFCCHQHIKFVL